MYARGASKVLPLASLPGMKAPEGWKWSPRHSHGPRVAHQGQALGWNGGHTSTIPRTYSCVVNPLAAVQRCGPKVRWQAGDNTRKKSQALYDQAVMVLAQRGSFCFLPCGPPDSPSLRVKCGLQPGGLPFPR